MRSLILCEGFDENLIIGYYIFKKAKYSLKPNIEISDNYKIKDDNKKTVKLRYIQRKILPIY